jgi:hypothetical protein
VESLQLLPNLNTTHVCVCRIASRYGTWLKIHASQSLGRIINCVSMNIWRFVLFWHLNLSKNRELSEWPNILCLLWERYSVVTLYVNLKRDIKKLISICMFGILLCMSLICIYAYRSQLYTFNKWHSRIVDKSVSFIKIFSCYMFWSFTTIRHTYLCSLLTCMAQWIHCFPYTNFYVRWRCLNTLQYLSNISKTCLKLLFLVLLKKLWVKCSREAG